MVKFSIITPSFNQGRFLPDCVESVLSQSDVEWEHIVTDAGSTDETLQVLERYPHLIWTSEPDDGMSDGINKGFLKATGDWLMWLNCDDYLLPGSLKAVSEFIQRNPDADVIHGDCVYVDEHKNLIRRKYDTPIDEWDLLFIGCIIPSTSSFYRKDLIETRNLLDVSYRNCMDWEYYLRLWRAGCRFRYIPEALAHFRWYQESTTQLHWQRMLEEGQRCQKQHLSLTNKPEWLGGAITMKIMRRIFQARRIIKRLYTHGRIK
jgi:glycosyltransferase involved in cell wall biosynthesis